MCVQIFSSRYYETENALNFFAGVLAAMRIDPKPLLDQFGIDCTKAEYIKAEDRVAFHPARIAFVTEDAVKRLPPPSDKAQKVRYGDALLVWTPEGAKPRGARVEAGKDAGVQIDVPVGGVSQMVPFTGTAMLSAREKLHTLKEVDRTADHRKAIRAIEGVLTIIMSNPDPARYSMAVIGNAFASELIDMMGRPALPVSIEEFGRKARADLLRARISMIDPDNPDGLGPLRPLQRILDDFGIGMVNGSSGLKVNGQIINEASLRRVASGNDDLRDGVFGGLTKTSVKRLSAAPMSSEDFEILCDGLSSHRITGGWIDATGRRISRIMSEAIPAYSCQVAAFAIDNRDILAVQDTINGKPGLAYAYSWPSMDRLPCSTHGAMTYVNISTEEIPTEEEIVRLQSVLDLLQFGNSSDLDIEIDGIQIPARGGMRRG